MSSSDLGLSKTIKTGLKPFFLLPDKKGAELRLFGPSLQIKALLCAFLFHPLRAKARSYFEVQSQALKRCEEAR